jgi:hypothetical protein
MKTLATLGLLIIVASLLTGCTCPDSSTWTATCEHDGNYWTRTGDGCACAGCGLGNILVDCSVYRPNANCPGLFPRPCN